MSEKQAEKIVSNKCFLRACPSVVEAQSLKIAMYSTPKPYVGSAIHGYF